MREHRYSKWFHQQVGYLWQNPDSQLFCGSVEEELAFGPEQMGLTSREVHTRVEDALSLLGIEKLRKRAPFTLSGGEKKKVAIASVLTMNPSVWTFDEPLSSLDEESRKWLLEFLMALKAAGKTLMISTHEIERIKDLVDKEIRINTRHQVQVV
jgi:cobalt/nickel transport system ATP-binding protein